MGYLYGTIGTVEAVKGEDGKELTEGGTEVSVEFVYEPQQACDPDGFEIADNEEAEKVRRGRRKRRSGGGLDEATQRQWRQLTTLRDEKEGNGNLVSLRSHSQPGF